MIFSFIENIFFRNILNLPRPDIIIFHLKSRTSEVTVQDIKALFGNLIEYFTDEEAAKDVREGLDTEFDSQVTTDGDVSISYFNDGWPQEVVSQDNISLGDRQKLKQKYITWDYRSVGHSE